MDKALLTILYDARQVAVDNLHLGRIFPSNHNTLVLSLPPSVNGMFPGKTRRFISPEYKRWLHEADLCLKEQWKYVATGLYLPAKEPWRLDQYFYMGDWRGKDLDNMYKASIDFLVKAIHRDDNRLIEHHAMKFVRKGHPTGVVSVVELL